MESCLYIYMPFYKSGQIKVATILVKVNSTGGKLPSVTLTLTLTSDLDLYRQSYLINVKVLSHKVYLHIQTTNIHEKSGYSDDQI